MARPASLRESRCYRSWARFECQCRGGQLDAEGLWAACVVKSTPRGTLACWSRAVSGSACRVRGVQGLCREVACWAYLGGNLLAW
eukprot:9244674-Alexandrium_andersonii.AAC.1